MGHTSTSFRAADQRWTIGGLTRLAATLTTRGDGGWHNRNRGRHCLVSLDRPPNRPRSGKSAALGTSILLKSPFPQWDLPKRERRQPAGGGSTANALTRSGVIRN
jgi:hypothetical protein